MNDLLNKESLNLSHTFAASLPFVYNAWTDPGILRHWWGPLGCEVYKCEVDLRPGGKWRYGIRTANGDREVFGEYLSVEPEKRLVFSWQWANDEKKPEKTIVTIIFRAESEDSTHLTMRQEAFLTTESCENHSTGWHSSFESLTQFLTQA